MAVNACNRYCKKIILVMFKIDDTGLLHTSFTIISVLITLCQISKLMSRVIINAGLKHKPILRPILDQYWHRSFRLINDLARSLR